MKITSVKLKEMHEKKKEIKRLIQQETDKSKRSVMTNEPKIIHDNIKVEMIKEKTSEIEHKFKKIIADKSRNSFWKEKRTMTRSSSIAEEVENVFLRSSNN